MNLAESSAHIIRTGPYRGQTVGSVAMTSAGLEWLSRVRTLIPAETTGSYGQLRTAINVFFSSPVNSRLLEANQS
jgi:hypothetical protein